MNLRGAKPINDNSVREFISSIDNTNSLYNDALPNQFVNNFFDWIVSSKNNNLTGLEKFTNRKLCAGTAQTFDHFYLKHKNKRFRFFKGEFMYHSACLKNYGKYKFLEDDRLDYNDAVIISVPFSDTGSQKNIEELLFNCYGMDIPVLLDFAYYPCTKNIEINLDKFSAVETVCFSISKAFYGAEFLRVGMRLQRENNDDGIDVFNSVEMVNRCSINIANKLISNYSVDYNWQKYKEVYEKVIKENNLLETDCIMFGLGGHEYADYNRGGDVNRVCVSELIGEKINGISK